MIIKYLLIVVKNTSVLDVAVPLLWKIKKENPNAEVSVLYNRISRKKILRKDEFYSKVLNEAGVKEFDYSDFLYFPFNLFSFVWKFLLATNERDVFDSYKKKYSFLNGLRIRYKKNINKLGQLLIQKINAEKIISKIDPEIVFLDNRFHNLQATFSGGEYIYNHFKINKTKVILLPHGAHHGGHDDFQPYAKDDPLPDYCEYWIPYRFDRNWESIPKKREQFFHSGYPGLDSEWLQFLEDRQNNNNKRLNKKSLRCLLVTRKFLKKGEASPPISEFTYSYDQYIDFLERIKQALDQSGYDIDLVIKPHPNNDFKYAKEVLFELGMENCSVTYDSIYSCMHTCDFIISPYSTTIIIPIMAGIPVLLLNSPWQDIVNTWEQREELYSNLRYYIEKPEDLSQKLKKILKKKYEKEGLDEDDVTHLRYYWPDFTMEQCLHRLRRGIKLKSSI